jgi:hypothetical protein
MFDDVVSRSHLTPSDTRTPTLFFDDGNRFHLR